MKSPLLIWNVILTIAVATLLFFQFGKKTESKTAVAVKKDSAAAKQGETFSIAYFVMDSIENNFSMVKDVKDELNKQEDGMTKELERIEKSIMAKAGEYQQKMNSGAMTQQQAEAANNDIIERRRSLESKRQEYDQQYKDVYMRKMQDVRTKIEDFLKEYNKNNTYSFIISNEPGFIYYHDAAYDITNDVVKGLNEKYKKADK